MIQLGKRNTRCALLVATALGVSGNVLAQPAPPAPEPAPAPAPAANEPAPAPAPNDQSAPAANPANPPAPGPPPVAAQPPVAPPAPPATSYPTMAGPALKLSDLFTWRPGVFLQIWGSFAQDAFKQSNGDAGDFARNIYLRRARFFMGGTIGSSLTYFLLWESANNGAPVVDATGAINKQNQTFAFNDAYIDFKINPNLSLQAGLMLLPFTRNILQSTSTYWTLDIGGVSASYIAATQTNILRDYGAQLKVNAVENHLELRGMVSEGVRIADPTPSSAGTPLPATARNAGKNNPRLTGYVQYNFLDPDTGYVFNGQYFGRKKIAGVAAGVDWQPVNSDNPYFATSLTGFAAIPINGPDPKNGGDEFGGQVEYLHFHGGRTGTPPAGLLKQDDVLVELGYYNKAAKFSVFGKFEGRFYSDEATKPNNMRIYAAGVKYFMAEQIANLTLMYSLTQFPDLAATTAAVRNDINAVQLQLQVGYF